MSVFGDELPQPKTINPSPGEDLYGLSLAELSARIKIYQIEIARLESETVKKEAEAQAAHAVFAQKS